MPRQILPGKDFVHWLPSDKTPVSDYHLYVYPELYIGADEIPDGRWNDWKWLEANLSVNDLNRRILRDTLNQLLYNGLISMMNNSFDSIKTVHQVKTFERELLELIRPKPDDIALQMATESLIYRLARCEPHAHYVVK